MLLWVVIGILFLEDLVLHLRETRRMSLNLINKPMETTLWRQGWLNSGDLELNGEFVRYWELFVSELHRDHIRLCENPNELIWSYNKVGGCYLVKLGY
jgi:hypothetical protein